ncbi:MAG TPA: TrkH family potassium uptake protein [Terriglobales bacterium]|nr:TrkH family potassium uptake protein [Terriglobales bacterium]
MNRKMHVYILGFLLRIEAAFMVPSGLISLASEEQQSAMAFFGTSFFMLVAGTLMSFRPPENKTLNTREGLRIAATSWVLVSVFGALPLYFGGIGASYLDCLFEIVSGFTTTGASIFTDVEILPKGILFWRSFTHWIGGMGVLVFLLSITSFSSGSLMYIMQAESPGPSVSKLVPKVKETAKILYSIYIFLTLIQIILLVAGGMPLFDSVLNTFGTAGTGGFSIKNKSIGFYDSAYVDYVIGIFMILFGVNFNAYFLLYSRKFKDFLKSEEPKVYLGIIAAAVLTITVNIYQTSYDSLSRAFRDAFFAVSSIITTTGYATADFDLWPQLSRAILLLLMFFGACAGSTGGGIKISRLIIYFKEAKRTIRQFSHPKAVEMVRLEGKSVDEETVSMSNAFLIMYLGIFISSVLLVSLDGYSYDTSFSAVAACLNNIGPGLGVVGPTGNYSTLSALSKSTLIVDMLMGRLEIFPIVTFLNMKRGR